MGDLPEWLDFRPACSHVKVSAVYCRMKDMKKTVNAEKAELMNVLNEAKKQVNNNRDSKDPPTQQLVKKLHRSASDSQIRYSRVLICTFANTL